ncbi:hypothetical protein KIPB_002071 [Kipferlia bialata]|uniref:Transcription and mRNA export factor SUS1 n=1 Tax=Kipferlia bialata TaxID=797122 RepID=A0A9K3CR85_9EUKA|nr:hypothetical protein KIPB_002071 [Kipferlia bialata]|eukprot:g2071.t1
MQPGNPDVHSKEAVRSALLARLEASGYAPRASADLAERLREAGWFDHVRGHIEKYMDGLGDQVSSVSPDSITEALLPSALEVIPQHIKARTVTFLEQALMCTDASAADHTLDHTHG